MPGKRFFPWIYSYIESTSRLFSGESFCLPTSLDMFFPVGRIFHFEKDLNIANVDMLQCPTRFEHAQQTSLKLSLSRAAVVHHCVHRGCSIEDPHVSNFYGLT